MSYVLINGKRYYKDDRTGRVVLDNVSQAEADRRMQRNQRAARSDLPWRAMLICGVTVMLIGAFVYNYIRISPTEEAIAGYMKAQQGNEAEDPSDTQEAYLVPDSAERYLEASEIENCSREEVQLMINEIYARHGREFRSGTNHDYFSAKEWYRPIAGKSDEEIAGEFNEFERANVDLLNQYR